MLCMYSYVGRMWVFGLFSSQPWGSSCSSTPMECWDCDYQHLMGLWCQKLTRLKLLLCQQWGKKLFRRYLRDCSLKEWLIYIYRVFPGNIQHLTECSQKRLYDSGCSKISLMFLFSVWDMRVIQATMFWSVTSFKWMLTQYINFVSLMRQRANW